MKETNPTNAKRLKQIFRVLRVLRVFRGQSEIAACTILLFADCIAIGLLDVDDQGRMGLTDYGREKLDPASPFHLRGYIGLGAFSADVQTMIDLPVPFLEK